MASSLQALILSEHPTPFFSIAELGLAFLALGPLPAFIPLVVLLAVLKIHGQRIAYRHTRLRELICSWISVTVGSSSAYWAAATTALSSPTQSLGAIVFLSSITYAVVLVPVYFDIRYQGRLGSDWGQLTLFPALWATCWSLVGHISPVGRLLNWAPVSGTHPYNWLMPLTGPAGIDWIVAAWAVVFSEFVAQWLMGFADHEPLGNQAQGKPSLLSPRSKGLLSLVTILLSLALPSLVPDLPLRVDDITHGTPITVGCVLPRPFDGSHAILRDFIEEMRKMSSANVLLWPESAVVFNSPAEREAAFAEIRELSLSALVGVAFEEYVVGDPAHTRNGFALVRKGQQPGEEVIHYYKRNLVPFTESFSKIPSIDPPTISEWPLSPPKGITKPEWSSNHTRPLFITSSICLDFASPMAFTGLESRPSLILAPARTWDTNVGLTMWEQAKTRASEVGGMVLWCDGGVTGVSGIGGGGIHEPMQIGAGSWLRRIAVPYPFGENRTVYAKAGEFSVIVFLVALMGGGAATNVLLMRSRNGVVRMLMGGRAALGEVPLLRRLIGPPHTEVDLLGAEEVGEHTSLLG